MQRDPGVQHRCRHTFSGKPVYLCRGRVDNSLYPVQGIRILFLLGYGRMGEEVCCILWKAVKIESCFAGFSACGGSPASDIIPLRQSAILAERFLSYRNEVSYTIKKPACSPGSSSPANDRKSVSKIFLPRKKPGQACGHILNHNYPFGGS